MVGDGVVEVARQGNALFVADLGSLAIARVCARYRKGQPPRERRRRTGALPPTTSPSRGRRIHAECRDDRDVCRPDGDLPARPQRAKGRAGPGRPSGPRGRAHRGTSSVRGQRADRPAPADECRQEGCCRRQSKAGARARPITASSGRQASPGRKATSTRTATAYTPQGRRSRRTGRWHHGRPRLAPEGRRLVGTAEPRGSANGRGSAQRTRSTSCHRPGGSGPRDRGVRRRCRRALRHTHLTQSDHHDRQSPTQTVGRPADVGAAKLAAAWAAFMCLYIYVDVPGFYAPGAVSGILRAKCTPSTSLKGSSWPLWRPPGADHDARAVGRPAGPSGPPDEPRRGHPAHAVDGVQPDRWPVALLLRTWLRPRTHRAGLHPSLGLDLALTVSPAVSPSSARVAPIGMP